MERLLLGAEVSAAIDKRIMDLLPGLYEKGIVPTLAIVRVGENPSDIAYENGAIKKAKKVGVQVEKFTCAADIMEDDLVAVINSINNNDSIHGILLLQPLPKDIDGERIRNCLSAEKDLDCISDDSLAKLFTKGSGYFPPCTAQSCVEILKHYNIEISGKRAVVIGRSMVIGKPVANMLLKENATVTVCHSRTSKEDMRACCKSADIIVAAAGKINMVTLDMVSPGQTVIDVGINFNEEGKMSGDVDFDKVSEIVGAITPVPRGVGSVTTSILMSHLVEAAEMYYKL